jgi:hypothetical protein
MRNKHHLTPKSRRGDNEQRNIILLHVAKHEAWHTIFGNRTLEEIITLLVRVHRMKKRCTKKLGRCLVEEASNADQWQASFPTTPALPPVVRRIH